MTTTADETLSDSELLAAEPGQMRVQKRNGTLEQVDLNKIVRANQRCAEGLDGVDPMMIAVRTIAGVHDGVTTSELDLLSIRTAAAHIVEEPNYSKFAARILSNVIDKEIRNQNIHAFSQSVVLGHQAGLVSDETAAFVEANKRKLNDAIDKGREQPLRVLRSAHGLRPLSPPSPRIPTRHRAAAVLLHARGDGTGPLNEVDRKGRSSSTTRSRPSTSCRRRRRCSTPARTAHSHFLLLSAPPLPTISTASTKRSRKMRSCRSSPAGSATTGANRARAGLAHQGHQRQVAGRGAVPESGERYGGRGQPMLRAGDARDYVRAPSEIEEVEERDLVLGIDGEFRKVTQVFSYENDKPMVSVTTKHSVVPVTVTDGHPFYAILGIPWDQSVSRSVGQLKAGKVRAEWVPVKELKSGDYRRRPSRSH